MFTDYLTSARCNFIVPIHEMTVDLFFIKCKKKIKNSFKLMFQAKIDFYKIINGKSRTLFKTPIVDWCQLLDGGTNNNFLIRMLITTMKAYTPEFIHNCPYSGAHNIRNTTVLKNLVAILPNGVFKLIVSLSTTETVILQFEINFTVV